MLIHHSCLYSMDTGSCRRTISIYMYCAAELYYIGTAEWLVMMHRADIDMTGWTLTLVCGSRHFCKLKHFDIFYAYAWTFLQKSYYINLCETFKLCEQWNNYIFCATYLDIVIGWNSHLTFMGKVCCPSMNSVLWLWHSECPPVKRNWWCDSWMQCPIPKTIHKGHPGGLADCHSKTSSLRGCCRSDSNPWARPATSWRVVMKIGSVRSMLCDRLARRSPTPVRTLSQRWYFVLIRCRANLRFRIDHIMFDGSIPALQSSSIEWNDETVGARTCRNFWRSTHASSCYATVK